MQEGHKLEENEAFTPAQRKRLEGSTKVQRKRRLDEFCARADAIDILCEFLAEGGSLRDFCVFLDVPYTSVYVWVDGSAERKTKYHYAMKLRAETLADKIQAVANDTSKDLMEDGDGRKMFNRAATERAKIQIDALKWTAAKLDPTRYCERLQQVVTGQDGGAVETSLTIKFEKVGEDLV